MLGDKQQGAMPQQDVLRVLRDSFGTTGAKSGELRDASSMAKTTFYRALNALVTRGAVRNGGTQKRPSTSY